MKRFLLPFRQPYLGLYHALLGVLLFAPLLYLLEPDGWLIPVVGGGIIGNVLGYLYASYVGE